MTVHNGEEPPSGLVFECGTPGATDLTLAAAGDDGETTGEATLRIVCREVTSVAFRPTRIDFLGGPLDRMPTRDRLVAVDTDFRFDYELYYNGDQLAGFGYDPFRTSDGVTAETHPTDRPTQNHRHVTSTSRTTGRAASSRPPPAATSRSPASLHPT